MKLLFILIASGLFFLPSDGQTFAYQKLSFPARNGSCNTNFMYGRHKRQNNKIANGGLMVLVGGVSAYWGTKLYAGQANQQTPNETEKNLGLGVTACAAVFATGIVVAIIGVSKKTHGHYGLEIIAPESNQIGIACNFR